MNTVNPGTIRAIGVLIAGAILFAALAGCTSYATPGRAASFDDIGILSAQVPDITAEARHQLTDRQIRELLAREPLASFPAHVAVAHIQDGAYRAYRTHAYGSGRISLLSTRDEKTVEAIEQLGELPGLAGLAPLNRMVVPERVEHERQLREAAATVHADMLLLYTFDTTFETDQVIPHLGLLTLGLFPDRQACVTTTASAALIDVRNGYVYGLAEGSADRKRGANAWTSRDAVDDARRLAEEEAFGHLVDELQDLWLGVLQEHAPQLTPAVESEIASSST